MLMPEKLRRVRLGLTMGRMKTHSDAAGIVVDEVTKDSPADKLGLAAGDIVLEIDDSPLTGIIDFYVKLMKKQIGEPISLKCVRPGEKPAAPKTVRLTLLARPLPDGRLPHTADAIEG